MSQVIIDLNKYTMIAIRKIVNISIAEGWVKRTYELLKIKRNIGWKQIIGIWIERENRKIYFQTSEQILLVNGRLFKQLEGFVYDDNKASKGDGFIPCSFILNSFETVVLGGK